MATMQRRGRLNGTRSSVSTADADASGVVGSPLRRGSHSLLRDINVSLLIELVHRSGPISRADLARRSGLSAPTVSNIVGQLLDRGIFIEVAMAPSSGGRPPVLLKVDPKAGYVIGIKLRGDGLTTVVCDLDAQVMATEETPISLIGDPAAAIQAIEEDAKGASSGSSPTLKGLRCGSRTIRSDRFQQWSVQILTSPPVV